MLQRSFYREDSYNWEHFTHLLIRCRGDGRPFHLILGMTRYFDTQWLDQYNFTLFTRGGPYWQTAKVSESIWPALINPEETLIMSSQLLRAFKSQCRATWSLLLWIGQ